MASRGEFTHLYIQSTATEIIEMLPLDAVKRKSVLYLVIRLSGVKPPPVVIPFLRRGVVAATLTIVAFAAGVAVDSVADTIRSHW